MTFEFEAEVTGMFTVAGDEKLSQLPRYQQRSEWRSKVRCKVTMELRGEDGDIFTLVDYVEVVAK